MQRHDTNPYKKEGLRYYNKGQYQDAVASYNKAIELDPASSELYRRRARAYSKQGKDKLAIADYTQAIALDPNSNSNSNLMLAYVNRGRLYSKQGKHECAIEDYNKAIMLEPTNKVVYNNRGRCYADLNQYQRAEADLKYALELDPQYAYAHGNLGYTYYISGNLELALSYLNKALESDSTYENAYLWRARIYCMQSQLAEAILDYLKVIDLNPEDKEVVAELKNLLMRHPEKNIYESPLASSNTTQINLIKKCFNPKTSLGKHFYGENFTQETFECLDLLAKYLNQLEPYLTVVSVTTASIFKLRENKYYVMAKNADAPYIQYIESVAPKSDESETPESDKKRVEYTPQTACAFHNKL
jgi:tetratricopeptide (TPR) repeat protein